MPRTDLDNPTSISRFVDSFYARVLRDPLLAPVFLEQAGINLDEHLPRIKAYWAKMLLGRQDYQRHMMNKHRAVDRYHPFSDDHYEKWLRLFEETLAENHVGPVSERAKNLARRVVANMRRNLRQSADAI